MEQYPDIGQAYKQLGDAVANAGPLDEKTRQLIKIGISISAGQEGGTHSQTRKALEAGATPEEIRHAVLQTLSTVGFPSMMMGMSWVDDVLTNQEEN